MAYILAWQSESAAATCSDSKDAQIPGTGNLVPPRALLILSLPVNLAGYRAGDSRQPP